MYQQKSDWLTSVVVLLNAWCHSVDNIWRRFWFFVFFVFLAIMSKNARVYTAEATLGCHHMVQTNYKPEINHQIHIFDYPEATWPQGDTFHPYICKSKAHNKRSLRVHLCHKSIEFLISNLNPNKLLRDAWGADGEARVPHSTQTVLQHRIHIYKNK